LTEWSDLQVEDIIIVLVVCLRTTYECIEVDDKFFQKKCGIAVEYSLSHILDIFTKHLEKLPVDSAQHKPFLWLQFDDDDLV
jgi:hypothetical protein